MNTLAGKFVNFFMNPSFSRHQGYPRLDKRIFSSREDHGLVVIDEHLVLHIPAQSHQIKDVSAMLENEAGDRVHKSGLIRAVNEKDGSINGHLMSAPIRARIRGGEVREKGLEPISLSAQDP